MPKSPAAASPQRNLTGLPRVARDIAADVYNNIQKWNDYHIKGANVIKEIGLLLSDNPKNFSPALETHTNKLHDIVQNLRVFSNALEFLANQMTALVKLLKRQCTTFHFINSRCLGRYCPSYSRGLQNRIQSKLMYYFHNCIQVLTIYLQRKEYVLENIAFSKDKSEIMFHASCWTYQENILKYQVNLKLETLLVETGHRKIT